MVETILREGRRRGVAVAATAGSAHRLGAGIREGFGQTVRAAASEPIRPRAGRGSGPPLAERRPAGQRAVARAPRAVPRCGAGAVAPSRARRRSCDRSIPAGFTAVVTASPRTDAAALRALGHEPVLLEPAGDAAVRVAVAARDRAAGAPRCSWSATPMRGWRTGRWPGIAREDAVIIVHGDRREYRVFATGARAAAAPRRSGGPVLGADARRRTAQGDMAAPPEQLKTSSRVADRVLNPHVMFPEINDSDMIA